MAQITQAQLKELFSYRIDGYLVRKIAAGRAKIGDVASSIDNKGYSRSVVGRTNYLSHRLIWMYHNDFMPKQIDHIDGNPLNNRIENLRVATQSENQQNTKIRSNNTTGYKGVYFHKLTGKYAAQARLNGKCIHIGLFTCPKEAAIAYNKAAKELFGEFARCNAIEVSED